MILMSERDLMEDQLSAGKILPYKFKEIKVYCNTEWLAENKKHYRQVFDRHETTFIYAELSFYNKLYDQENWEADIVLRCYNINKTKKEICKLQFVRNINKFDQVGYIREGWGNKKDGAFWKKGTYYWEAWINNEKVGNKYFYIEDAGSPFDDAEENPYLKLQSVKLYEGPYDDVNEDDRKYFKLFNGEETRYIYTEAIFKNQLINTPWQCELAFKFFNEARELKGQVTRLQTIRQDEETIKVIAGWGSNMKNTWKIGNYNIDIIFMGFQIATIPFIVDFEFEEGYPPVYLPYSGIPLELDENQETTLTFDDVIAKLNGLIGLKEIKKQIKEHAQYIQFIKLRKERGFEENERIPLHSVFIGKPGTGKTTVANMMGMLYHKMGVLTKGHVHIVDRVDLVGEYIGQTAPKVREAIEKARGGVLFVDEAYSLARVNDDSKDFGREVIELLMKEMSDGPGDLAIVVAGYPKEMNYFLNSNPGLKSRFKNYLDFPDYLPQELSEIGAYAANEKEINLSPEAKTKLDQIITEAYRNRDATFGNARYVNDLIDKAKINLALRIMSLPQPHSLEKEILATVTGEDVERIKLDKPTQKPLIPIDEIGLKKALQELDMLIGIGKVKSEIHELVSIVRYYHLTGKDVLHNFFLHTVFIGNPGTGKTTVARILAAIYKALGILERGHMVETDRHGLVAGFVGQTALKTAEKVEEALGGVLFIDEAYALTTSTIGADYGQEAIQTLLKRMEDKRGEFFVFAAGYPDNMETFMKANPGLSSRFDRILRFEDYQPEELITIGVKMLEERGFSLSPEGLDRFNQIVKQLYLRRDKYFGNARTIRSVILNTIKNYNLRLTQGIDPIDNKILLPADFNNFETALAQITFERKGIGFN